MTENDLGYPGWRVTLAAAFGVFISFASVVVYTFGVFLKPLTEAFGWSREAVSVAFGISAMTVAVCSPPLGLLLDRFGPRRIILPCVAIFGISFVSLGWLTPHLWHLYVVFFVIGIVANGTAQMAYSRAVSTWFDRRRGMAFALLMTGGAVGAIVLPRVTQWIISSAGWRTAFVAMGSSVLFFGLPVVAFMIREHPASRSHNSTSRAGATVRDALRSRAFWLVVASLFLVSLGQNSAITHMPALLSDKGVTAGGAAMALSILGAASLVGRIGTGWLLDQFHAPHVSFLLLVLAAAGVFLLSTAQSAWDGCAAAALIGIGLGGEADVTPYLISRYFGVRSFATLYGFTWTAYAIAGAVGPILMGRAFDATHSYASLLMILGVFTIIAAGLMLFMPAYRPVGGPVVATVTGRRERRVPSE